jgi:hypothetical protein
MGLINLMGGYLDRINLKTVCQQQRYELLSIYLVQFEKVPCLNVVNLGKANGLKTSWHLVLVHLLQFHAVVSMQAIISTYCAPVIIASHDTSAAQHSLVLS